jgi:hypothetical protein
MSTAAHRMAVDLRNDIGELPPLAQFLLLASATETLRKGTGPDESRHASD